MYGSGLEIITQHFFKHEVTDSKNDESGRVGRSRVHGSSAAGAISNTILGIFRRELAILFDILSTSKMHYIRCIKPNNQKVPGVFDGAKVLEQLKWWGYFCSVILTRSNGIFETVRLRKAGYAHKFPFETLSARYGMLGFDICYLDCIGDLLESLGFPEGQKNSWAIGKTWVSRLARVVTIPENCLCPMRCSSI